MTREPGTTRQELYRLYAKHAELTEQRIELQRQITDLEMESMNIATKIAELEEQKNADS